MSEHPLVADIAVGFVPVPEDEAKEDNGSADEEETYRVAVPCIIHAESGSIIWEGDPIPTAWIGLQMATAVMKQLHNDMRRNREWHEVWEATDWSILGQLQGANRKARRASRG